MLISAFSIVSVRKLILFWTAGPRSLATDPDKVKSTIPVLLGKGSDDRGRPGEGGSPAPISCDLCKITEPMMIEGALKVFWFLPFLNIGTPPPTSGRDDVLPLCILSTVLGRAPVQVFSQQPSNK